MLLSGFLSRVHCPFKSIILLSVNQASIKKKKILQQKYPDHVLWVCWANIVISTIATIHVLFVSILSLHNKVNVDISDCVGIYVHRQTSKSDVTLNWFNQRGCRKSLRGIMNKLGSYRSLLVMRDYLIVFSVKVNLGNCSSWLMTWGFCVIRKELELLRSR